MSRACLLFVVVAVTGGMAFADKPKAMVRPANEKLFDDFTPSAPFKASATAVEAAKGYDDLILEAAKEKNLQPAPLVGDEAFLRRVSVDLMGRIPTARERSMFLSDKSEDRRLRLVRSMLQTEAFSNRMTVFFGDILRVRARNEAGDSLHQFIKQSIRSKRPYDQMVRTMITARGALGDPSVGFLVAEAADPMAMPGIVAQEFLGIRMSCAQCHDHPFDTWTQQQYYSFAAYFGRLGYYAREKPSKVVRVVVSSESSVMWPPAGEKGAKPTRVTPAWPVQMLAEQDPHATMLDRLRARTLERPPEAKADEEMDALIAKPVEVSTRGMVKGMENDDQTLARINAGDTDREAIAKLITSPRNRFFAWHLVNRLWGELIGTPMVNPVDDFRTDNPPSNPKLLNRLADEFVASGYDLRFLVESIVASDAYQRQRLSTPASERLPYEKAYVASPLRRLSAEAIYDSLVTAGHLSEYKHPAGTFAREVTYTVYERRYKPATTEKADAKPKEEATMMASAVDTGADPETLVVTGTTGRFAAEEIEKRVSASLMEMDKIAAQEAEKMAMTAAGTNVEMVAHKVTEVRDENPKFDPSSEMALPAPADHMLRQFGQPARATLGEARDRKPSTRQSLILLNGQLVNEAARVGDLEPMGVLVKNAKSLDAAIELAYIEALTRKPTSAEVEAAKALIAKAANARDGVADLRWVLLNSLEFRYLQ